MRRQSFENLEMLGGTGDKCSGLLDKKDSHSRVGGSLLALRTLRQRSALRTDCFHFGHKPAAFGSSRL